MKNDTLRLANDVLDNIKNALGMRNDDPPPELVRKVFSKFSFLSDEDVDMIVKDLSKGKESNENTFNEDFRNLKEEVIFEAYSLSMKKERFKEGLRYGQHYVASNSQNFNPQDWKIYSFLREELGKEKLDEEEEENKLS
jgi:hypothetical protein